MWSPFSPQLTGIFKLTPRFTPSDILNYTYPLSPYNESSILQQGTSDRANQRGSYFASLFGLYSPYINFRRKLIGKEQNFKHMAVV